MLQTFAAEHRSHGGLWQCAGKLSVCTNSCRSAPDLKVPSFSGNRTPIITATVCESNGRTNQFREINVIKRSQLNGDIVPADFLYVTAGE